MALIGSARAPLAVSMTLFGLQVAVLTIGNLLYFVLPKRAVPVVFVESGDTRTWSTSACHASRRRCTLSARLTRSPIAACSSCSDLNRSSVAPAQVVGLLADIAVVRPRSASP